MPDTDTPIPASQNFTKLKAKLRELFELDKADLDFGIYRVLRQRHTEIAEFLDKHLETTVRSALTEHGSIQTGHLEDELAQAMQAAKLLRKDPETFTEVLVLRERIAKGSDLEATADEVYSHLLTFFSRYYQGGDFLGLHRSTVHGQERYMIPYNGEEVKLIWANMDQYYIKSSELLRDYNFKVAKNLGEIFKADPKDVFTVQFKLIEGDTEKDNRKADSKSTRAFSLDTDTAFVEADEHTLTIHFRYSEHPSERSLQDKLNTDTDKTLADTLPPKWKELLFAADPSYQPKDKKDSRTVFQKHLRSYTAKHLFDYFIHKDLGGFLRRELDFYIKNEVMHLDDIENSTAAKAEEYLSKIRAIRRCALPVIRMVAQLEEFQKKLWLKKKFVVGTRYCLTLDRVPEALYADICQCEAQWKEWEELLAISEAVTTKNTKTTNGLGSEASVLSVFSVVEKAAFLKAHPHLMVDTKHFEHAFTLKLLASIDDLDASLDGVCFHSENFQALQLMQERYREQVKCVYIDPPYNTGNDGFSYRDGYQRSSWASAISQSLSSASSMLRADVGFFASIDDNEIERLKMLLESGIQSAHFLAHIVWQKRYAPDTRTAVSDAHEHILAFTKDYDRFKETRRKLPLTDKQRDQFGNADNDPKGPWKAADFTAQGYRPNQMYEIELPSGRKVKPPPGRCWVTTEDKFMALLSAAKMFFPRDGDGLPAVKRYLADMDGMVPWTWWEHTDVGHSQGGMKVTMDLFGREGSFLTAKPPKLVERTIFISAAENAFSLDYFAGSGTTGHAVINLNREDEGQRKYLLVEMGEHFDTVLIPRLKKVVYSTDWKEGKPQTRNTGISHAFKIVRLESYEDTLNNLHLTRSKQQETALANATETQRDAYLLGYFLDVESEGSASLLDVGQFRDPFGYKLHIATSSAGETKETNVDLVETFNWLLGLKVKHTDHQKGFLTVTGERRAGGRCLILWRSLSTDEKADNTALVKYLEKITVSPADTEYDFIYLNGPHTLNDPHNKVHLIEETFHRLMFDTTNFESLS